MGRPESQVQGSPLSADRDEPVVTVRNKQIYLNPSAGFCFGVARAVGQAEALAKEAQEGKQGSDPRPLYMLGPLVHNARVLEDLKGQGFHLAENPGDVPPGARVVIRAHGTRHDVLTELRHKACEIWDETCPYVAKLQRQVRQEEDNGAGILILGDRSHPEIQGVLGHLAAPEKVLVAGDLQYLSQALDDALLREKGPEPPEYWALFAQTTFDPGKFLAFQKIIQEKIAKIKIFATICKVTSVRIRENRDLAARMDLFFVVGSHDSSNTTKLFQAARDRCRNCYFIDGVGELEPILARLQADGTWKGARKIGVSAGASTPKSTIWEVIHLMTEHEVLQNQQENNEAASQEEIESVEGTPETEVSSESSSDVREETHEAQAETSTATKSTETEVKKNDEGDVSFSDFIDSIPRLKPGTVVTGNMIRYDDDYVYVDVKDKSEGKVPRQEFEPDYDLDQACKEHAAIEVFIRRIRNTDMGKEIILSKTRVDFNKHKEALEQAYLNREPVTVRINSLARDGVIANYGSINVYINKTQLELRAVKTEDLKDYLNQSMEIIITNFDNSRKRLRVSGSRKAILLKERKKAAKEIWDEIEVGKEYDGVVRNISTFGAFVDLGGVDGLVHISELSWRRVKHPSDIVNVGDIMHVFVKDFDREKNRISLGFKRPENDPYYHVEERYPLGSIVRGIVVRVVDFGTFVEIAPGLDALCHISQISNYHLDHPSQVLKEGMEVDARVIETSNERRRISISIKDVEPIDPPDAEESALENWKSQGTNSNNRRSGRRPRRRSDDHDGESRGPRSGSFSYTDDSSSTSTLFGTADITVASKAGAEIVDKLEKEAQEKEEQRKAAEEKQIEEAKRKAEEAKKAEAEAAAAAAAEAEAEAASEATEEGAASEEPESAESAESQD